MQIALEDRRLLSSPPKGSGKAFTEVFVPSSCTAIPQSSIVIPVMAVMSTNAGKSGPKGEGMGRVGWSAATSWRIFRSN